jgi:imidazolonepropionase-like amidohydrolase
MTARLPRPWLLGLVSACLVLLALEPVLAESEVMVIHAGQLLAIPGESPRPNRSIVLRGDRIVDVVDGLIDPEKFGLGTKYLDLSGYFVLPGLMDMHVHLLGEIDLNSNADMLTVTPSIEALRGAKYAKATLMAGFTTVRDLGGTPEAIFALRDAIALGDVPGPRVFATGSYLSATGGHGDMVGFSADLMEFWLPDTVCDGPYECRKATRHAVKIGADWIKLIATGGVLSDVATGTDQQLTDDELKEIVDTAHALGRKVAAHAHGVDGIVAALRAGVDSIDHGSFTDAQAIRLFEKTGAYLVPTLLPGHVIPDMMDANPYFTEAIKEKVRSVSAAANSNFARSYRAGVNIAFGTDSGVSKHGENAREFALMVEAGMTPMDAIVSATIATAALLNISDESGTIESGKLADIIAVSGDPLEDISVLETVDVVIRAGSIAKHCDRSGCMASLSLVGTH